MNILLIGSGGREHALAWAISQSPRVDTLFCAPGNPGMEECGICAPLDGSDHAAIIAFCREQRIDLVVVGPEGPLVAGLVDDLEEAGIPAFGPRRGAAMLEASKGFTKDLCRAEGIPTADYARFTDAGAALAHLRRVGAPIVVKYDGLASGKGVVVAATLPEAEAAVERLLAKPGDALVIESVLTGEEASFFVLCDGETAVPLASAQDHKRAFDGDLGPNTGGMGAFSPSPSVTPEVEAVVMERIIRPTLNAMVARGAPFRGVLYAGLMLTAEGPKLIEYNVRFGDPECQALVMRLHCDLVPVLLATVEGGLRGVDLRWRRESAITVVLAARGYPGTVERGTEIRGLAAAASRDDVVVFHAGTRRDGDRILADGGRVLAVCARGADLAQARSRAYEAVAAIDWPEGFCRADIGLAAAAKAKRT